MCGLYCGGVVDETASGALKFGTPLTHALRWSIVDVDRTSPARIVAPEGSVHNCHAGGEAALLLHLGCLGHHILLARSHKQRGAPGSLRRAHPSTIIHTHDTSIK